ncbi:MAG: CTP synthase [Armatimonadetes bacterium]|nr:CTP synthase [Armatimonadota bacterium]
MTKYCFVTGGVVSGIGKGISSASIGRLLKARGYKVAITKMDPYINVDAGLMNPFQHGEVFVTDDGSETDLDLGHYERFVDEPLSALSNLTTGQVYGAVISKERDGDYYLGQTVQVIPHITDEIKSQIRKCAQDTGADVCIVEIGGTVGDIEGMPFLEAIRQMRADEGPENTCYVHVTLVPWLPTTGELKTKPTQHSVRELRGVGIHPEILIIRTSQPMGKEVRRKLALFCDVPPENIIEALDVKESLYHIPLAMEEQGIADIVCRELDLPQREPDLTDWIEMCNRVTSPEYETTVAMVGKYMNLKDAYLSVTEALTHGGIANNAAVNIKYVDSEDIEENGAEVYLSDVDGVLVPGGFGDRGIEGKISAIGYAREHDIPYLGLCLGLQTAVIEFARNVCGLKKANSREFDEEAEDPVIIYLKEQEYITELGGTMRLGAYPCKVQPDTLAARLYGSEEISERHRHRLEVNNEYRDILAEHGLVFSGTSPEGDLVEMIELPDHPFFIASQFHPEFKSRPNRAHPLFRGFIEAALRRNGSI